MEWNAPGDVRYCECTNCKTRVMNIPAFRSCYHEDFYSTLVSHYPQASITESHCPVCYNFLSYVHFKSERRLLEFLICTKCEHIVLEKKVYLKLPLQAEYDRKKQKKLKDEKAWQKEQQELIANTKQVEAKKNRESWVVFGGKIGIMNCLMGLPELGGVKTRLDKIPKFTICFILVCLGAIILEFIEPELMIDTFAFNPSEPFKLMGLTLFTSCFLHAGLLHLFGNLFFLLLFGIYLENHIGLKKFLILCLAGTFMGSITFGLLNSQVDTPSVGASDAVFAVITYFTFCFPRASIYLPVWIIIIPVAIRIPVIVWFLIYMGWTLFSSYLQIVGLETDLTNHLAHAGGAFAGFVLFMLWERKKDDGFSLNG